MSSILSQHVLVLNRLWQAVNVCTARRALTLLFQGHAQAVLNGADGEFQTYNFQARHTDAKRDGMDGFGMRRLLGQVMPGGKIVRLERAVGVIEHDLRMALEEQGEGAPRGADIDRLPEAV